MSGARRRAERLGYKAFKYTPLGIRQRIVRLIKPSFTVGVMSIITRDDGALLLVRHSYLDGWSFPGGLINRREESVDALRREALEEVGLRIALVGEPVVTLDPDDQIVRIVHRAVPASGVDPDSARPSSEEIIEVRWWARSELPTMLTEASGALAALERSEEMSS